MTGPVLSDDPFIAAEIIAARKPGFRPRVGLILGSGLGPLADRTEDATTLSYRDLPGFPASGVHGHAGELVLGRLAGQPVACMKGRGHFYERGEMGVMTVAVRTLRLIGCETLFITNAAGSLRPEVGPGHLVALSDHINTMPGTPLVGPNDDRFGERFFSVANLYDAGLRADLARAASAEGISLETGVFVSYPGPNFETPAEIRMMAILGGHVVGMSVVPEALVARHCGLKVAAVSVITNLAEGLSEVALSHEQTLKYAATSGADLNRLILRFLAGYAQA
ncbi:xanthosine phosphorylase [Deinococcus sp.]|uniref:xanthosine phosphorylase n=1 Tax=Deinococcus sp. TaxID=47478 RepID=UPI003C798CFC